MSPSIIAHDRFELEGVDAPAELISPTIRTLASHESRRSFQDRDVSAAHERVLLTAGRSAPSSSNLQAFSVIVVRDAARRARLAALVGGQRFVADAPLFFAFCADVHRLRRVCERQGRAFEADTLEMFLLASVDAALCMQNTLVAAESLGLAGVPVGSVRNDPEAVAAELGLPDGVVAIVGLSVGWPRGEGRGPKPRLPVDATVHREQYTTEGLESALREYDATMIERAVYVGRHVAVSDEDPGEEDDEDYGWAEHTARRCSRPEALGAASLREHLREQVQARGFALR